MRTKTNRFLASFLLALLLLTVLVGSGKAAEVISASFRLLNLPLVHLTTVGLTSVAEGQDSSNHHGKRSFVRSFTFESGVTECQVLFRVETDAKGHLWIDAVAARDIGELTTRVAAMDLSQTAIGHPHPTDDLVDASALTDAGD